MSTTIALDLLDAIRAHLAEFDLPGVCSVQVTASDYRPHLSVQMACHEPPGIAAALLAWADTLTEEVTATAWRVPAGDSVHLSITGHLPSGTPLDVYGSTSFTASGIGRDLDPGSSVPISLATLRGWATLPEVPTR